MLAQIAITGDAIAQGGVLAGILAGFAFVGATSAINRPAVMAYFTSGMFLLVSLWAGLMGLMSKDPAAADVLATVFFLTMGIGSVLFVLATVGHFAGLQGRRTAVWCLILAFLVSISGITLVLIALR